MPHSGGKLEWITRKYFQCPAQLPSKADSGCYYSISLRENLTFLWMWELDYKESSALKNWCFWTVVLEKTLESPLDCKEIQPAHPKGNQSWIFLEGLMLKLKLQYYGHLMQRTNSFEKMLMLGKIEGGRRRGQQKMRCWMASSTQWAWVWVSSGSWW